MSEEGSVPVPEEAAAIGAAPPKRRRLWLRIADAIVFGGALLLAVTAVSSTIAQPFAPGRVLAYTLLAPLATIVFHRGLAFLQRRMRRRSGSPASTASLPFELVKWLGAPIAAVFVCGGLEAFVQERAFLVAREDLGPVVRAIEAKLSLNEPAPGDILDALGAAHQVGFVVYLHRERAFVLVALGGSIDMDGEKIYYDSEDRKWRRFHNDLEETDDPDATHWKAATRNVVERIEYRRHDTGWSRFQRQ
jgi:hypothetical protein